MPLNSPAAALTPSTTTIFLPNPSAASFTILSSPTMPAQPKHTTSTAVSPSNNFSVAAFIFASSSSWPIRCNWSASTPVVPTPPNRPPSLLLLLLPLPSSSPTPAVNSGFHPVPVVTIPNFDLASFRSCRECATAASKMPTTGSGVRARSSGINGCAEKHAIMNASYWLSSGLRSGRQAAADCREVSRSLMDGGAEAGAVK